MPKTLLAIDDSVTMRKVLEITFSGEDFRVITAENAQSALGKLSGETPGVFVVDTVLGGDDGYALAKELRRRAPSAALIVLASRYAPYDAARGRDAGVDDWADKPFDTQQLIDKVKKVIAAKEANPAAVAAPSAAAAPAPGPARGPSPSAVGQATPSPPQVSPAPSAQAAPRGAQPSLGNASARTGTLVFGESPFAAAPVPGAAQAPPRPAAGTAQAYPASSQSRAPSTATLAPGATGAAPSAGGTAAMVSAAVAANGQFAGKLGELGLSGPQAEAVLALSRDVVERVVWEVVPQLAETLIREEIARLMHE